MSKLYVVVALLVLANPVLADWWYTYEAADGTFPEQQGWYRATMGGGGQRSLEDGTFVLDTSPNPAIVDFYYRSMPSLPDPNDPTHAFVCEWGLRVDAFSGSRNPEVFLAFQGHSDMGLEYETDRIYSFGEFKYIAAFEPGVSHDYRLVTSDMVTYTLAIDTTPVYTGELSPWAPSSFVQFGDATPSGASLSRWQYLRYGVIEVPEPRAILLCATAALGAGRRVRRRAR